jgi:hypothetical protein
LSSPHHYKWGGLNLPRISVRQRRRQGTSRPTIVIPPLGVSPITNLPSMLRGPRNSTNSQAPWKIGISLCPRSVCRQLHEYRHPHIPRTIGACCNGYNDRHPRCIPRGYSRQQ